MELRLKALPIRPGTLSDARRLSDFIVGLSKDFIVGDFVDKARQNFLADHSEEKVRERLAGAFRFYVAEDDGTVAGVAAIRDNSHLYYLFVGKRHQRSGLARQLWAHVMAESLALGNPGRFTVNASNYAVPAYEKLGFKRKGTTVNADGVLYNPMEQVTGR